mmetsp:Transcript_81184/g.134108  ORF Transcript_81184/g.134108 Transcript_81184/m.134108 type:complete len:308 (+) Transcript_81184:389-1312(+)
MEQARLVQLVPKVPHLTDGCRLPPRVQVEQGEPAVQPNPKVLVADRLVQTGYQPSQCHHPMGPEGLLVPAVPKELKVSMIPVAGTQHLMVPEELKVLMPPLVPMVPVVPAALPGGPPEPLALRAQALPGLRELRAVPSEVQAESMPPLLRRQLLPRVRWVKLAVSQRPAEPVDCQAAEPPGPAEQVVWRLLAHWHLAKAVAVADPKAQQVQQVHLAEAALQVEAAADLAVAQQPGVAGREVPKASLLQVQGVPGELQVLSSHQVLQAASGHQQVPMVPGLKDCRVAWGPKDCRVLQVPCPHPGLPRA